ncbi:MAG TPA: ATP-binding protein [Nitrospirae bacterium]|nr:ATP-binding protein [Nitrospirota bacterium]HDZ00571.1 ATP-binding protein [Nitrospirota bacterium]
MKYIDRLLLNKLKKGFKNNRIIIITGSRQVGKTTVMEMYQESIPGQFRRFYFNLEDISYLNICQSADNLKSYLKDNGVDIESRKIFLIIDEFQYIKNATRLFKILYDLYPQVKILASGSSSIEIQKHLKESLAGRKKVYNLYTLSFEEFIRFKNEDEYSRYSKLKFQDVSGTLIDLYNKDYLEEFLVYGGYPKTALVRSKTEKIEELQDIYNSYIQKDIKSLLRGEDISAYNNLLKVLASQIGNLLNVNELSNTLNIGRRQVLKYLDVLEQTFIIKLLSPFYSNKSTEISKMPKLYLLDSGIINFSIGNFGKINYRSNAGSYVENFIFNEIIKYKPIQYSVYFWRTKLGTEIDFILEGNDELIPVEVKWQNITGPAAPRNLISFSGSHKNIKKAVIVTRTFSGKIRKEGKNIYFIPAVLFNKFIKSL